MYPSGTPDLQIKTHHWHNLLSWQHQRITNSMDQSSALQANSSSAALAIHGILWNSSSPCSPEPNTCHYPEPDQSNPPLPFPTKLLMIHFNIILQFTPRSSKWSPSLMSPHQNPVCTSPLSIRDRCPVHVIFLDHNIIIIIKIIFIYKTFLYCMISVQGLPLATVSSSASRAIPVYYTEWKWIWKI